MYGGYTGGSSTNTDNYRFVVLEDGTCKAVSWKTGSRVEWKRDINLYTKSALDEIVNTDVYTYRLKKTCDMSNDELHIGFVIGDGYALSDDILSEEGGSIDMYSAIALGYKGIQELYAEIKELKSRLAKYESA